MKKSSPQFDRRHFIKTSTTFTAGLAGFSLFPQQALSMGNADEGINVIGPIQGFFTAGWHAGFNDELDAYGNSATGSEYDCRPIRLFT